MEQHRSKPSLRVAGGTDRGGVRQKNEDTFFIDLDRQLMIVSDGMGGHQGGDLASRMVVDGLSRLLRDSDRLIANGPSAAVRNTLCDAMVAVSNQLRVTSDEHPALRGMGATVVLALVCGDWAYVAHMGDSRAYHYRDQQLNQLTEDHSVIAMLLKDGAINDNEAQSHPAKGQLTRYVGMESEVYPEVQALRLRCEDRLLLCSDGLTGMISDDEISEILRVTSDTERACESLILAANSAGGHDNVTTVLIDIVDGQ